MLKIMPKSVLVMMSCAIWLISSEAQTQESSKTQISGIDLNGFDVSIRPQDDFYAYVNGGWLASTEIPADKTMAGMLDIMGTSAQEDVRGIIEELAAIKNHAAGTREQLVADFFRAYMNSDRIEILGVEPVQEQLQAISDTQSVAALMQLGARLGREGIRGLLGVRVEPDYADPTRYMAVLRQKNMWKSGLTLSDREYYLADEERFKLIRSALPTYIASLFKLAGIPEAAARGRAVFELEAKIALAQQPARELRDIASYNLYEVSALKQLSPDIDWAGYLEAAGLAGQSQIVVQAPAYVAGLGKLLREESLDSWKNYWTFRVLHESAILLSSPFVQARFDFSDRLVNGVSEMAPRSLRATQQINQSVNRTLGHVMGRLYVERHFQPRAKAYVEGLADNVMAAYARAIDQNEWMSEQTKVHAHEKLDKITARIGYPDVWPDHSGLRILADDLVGNVRRTAAYGYDQKISKLSRPVDRNDWMLSPQIPTGYYHLTANAFMFTAALIQPPIFVPGADDAFNYAGIGGIIGHEIGHAFDDEGRMFDGDGKLNDWWTEHDQQQFKQRAARLVEHFNQFEPLEGIHINGQRTLGENIADLTGITIAYDAYIASLDGKEAPAIDGFTGPQRFFIGYALVWRNKLRDERLRRWLLYAPQSPPKERVNGPLSHIPEFYEAFDVQAGDGMWIKPEQRAKIW